MITQPKMATGKDSMKITTKDSEELIEFCCSTCEDNGHKIEAKKFCRDCDAYFCVKCTKHHKKFPALRNHVVTDIAERDASLCVEPSPDIEPEDLPKCVYHHGNDIIRFCQKHDELCCTVCMAVKHRFCESVTEITEAAKGVKQSKEYTEKKKSLENVLASLHNATVEKRTLTSEVKIQKEKLLEDVDKYEEELIARIKELSCKSKHEVELKYGAMEATLQNDCFAAEAVVSSTTRALNLLTSSNEMKAFIQTKHSESVLHDSQNFLQQISDTHKVHEPKFVMHKAVLKHLNSCGSLLVDVTEEECVKEYEAVLTGRYLANANVNEIIGLLIQENGDIIFVDCCNKRLRIVKGNFEEKASLDLPTYPIGLCQTARNEVVTSLRDLQKVQYISTDSGKLTCTSTIDVGCSCWGVAFVPEKCYLIVNCDPDIKVYESASRKLVRAINRSIEWSVSNTSARLCTYNSALKMIVLVDYYAGLFAMNLEGKLLWQSSETELKYQFGVCVLPSGIILVCSYESGKILQVDRNGKMIRTLIEGLGSSFSMLYDKQNSRLLVGCRQTLTVFALKKKL